jgi:hypothetical protein
MADLDQTESNERRRQEEAARLEQRLNDPEWQPLATYIRKKLGEEFTLDYDELLYLVHGAARTQPVGWPGAWPGNVARLLAVLSNRYTPKGARRLLDAMLAGRREQRKRPTAERNAIWKRWHDEDKLGPAAIAQRWWEERHQRVTANAVKQALRRFDSAPRKSHFRVRR